MLPKILKHRVQNRTLLLLAIVFICSPALAKGYLNFKLNPEYVASYPEDWYRTDPTAKNLVVSPIAEKETYDPPVIQIRCYDLTDAEAALPDSEFIELQLQNHIDYLEDNLNFDYEIATMDSISIKGADQAFCFQTSFPGEEPAVSETNYARKGKRMFIFRFWSLTSKYEKYLTDYYVMRGSFELK